MDDQIQKHYTVSNGFLDKRPLTFGAKVNALAPFCERFVFFSPAVLYLWGCFSDRILIDFLEQINQPVEFYYHRFNKPLFRGLETPDGNADWNHVLWAISVEYWPAFLDHMCAAMLHHTQYQMVFRVGYQEYQILDPLRMDRAVILPTDMPLVTIGSFGVSSNKFTAGMDYSGHPLLAPPILRFQAADRLCETYAEALFHAQSLTDLSSKIDDNLQESFRENTLRPAPGHHS